MVRVWDRAPGYMTIRCDRHEWKINPLMWHFGRTDRKQTLQISCQFYLQPDFLFKVKGQGWRGGKEDIVCVSLLMTKQEAGYFLKTVIFDSTVDSFQQSARTLTTDTVATAISITCTNINYHCFCSYCYQHILLLKRMRILIQVLPLLLLRLSAFRLQTAILVGVMLLEVPVQQ